jgi:hypothetical protein
MNPYQYHEGLELRIGRTKDWAAIEGAMEALISCVVKRAGVDTNKWITNFTERAEDGALYGARVFENPDGGGRI